MKIAFLFSGQGAQYPGMMKDLYESNKKVKEIYEKSNQVLERSISDLSFWGTQEELNLTHNTQPCVLTADIAAGEALRSFGVKPDVVAGFSLGEYAAMYFAGVLNLDFVFSLIQVRADAMQEACPVGKGAMAALLNVTSSEVEELCNMIKEDYVVPANYNSLVQTVVSGTTEGVDKLLMLAEKKGIRATKLAVSAPFHCKLMEPAAKVLESKLEETVIYEANIPVYLNYTGETLKTSEQTKKMLVYQSYNAVQWVKTLQNMKADGVDTFIECGPGKTLTGLVKKTLKDVTVLRVENLKTLNETLDKLGVSR